MSDARFWLGFNLVPGVGPVKVARLLERFGDLGVAWSASSQELTRAGLDARAIEAIVSRRASIDLDRELARVERVGAHLLTLDDRTYPERLRQIYAPPPLLYVWGEVLPQDDLSVAVVGTRRATTYGRQAAERIVTGLSRSGVTVVSGMARGIDSFAHRAALDAGGRTLAVLGCGVDFVYPPENAKLARSIVEHGALISEYPMSSPPEQGNFPARNRLISGLARGTLIVEADVKSGALITANFAAEQNRDVLAVPGSILSRQSEGTNRLIQSGAKLTTCAEDILEELNLVAAERQIEMRELLPADETEAALLKHLSSDPQHVDDIARATGMPIATVTSTLTMMELKGLVRQMGGMNYVTAV